MRKRLLAAAMLLFGALWATIPRASADPDAPGAPLRDATCVPAWDGSLDG